MTNRQVLMLIAAFVALSLGSFIWYIATWDGDARVGQTQGGTPSFILSGLRPIAPETLPQSVSITALTLPPEAPAFSTGEFA